jgi:hypothetical protein
VLEVYKKLPNYFGVWSTCALNINFACARHHDSKDFRGGFCWVIPFGTFTSGGELVFEDMKLLFDMAPGNVVAFRSFDIYHSVKEYSGGVRNSLVLFTHNEMILKGMKEYDRMNKRTFINTTSLILYR